jgi:hypothetical protein
MEGQKGGRRFLVKIEEADLRGLETPAAISPKKKTLEKIDSI